jgi:hypothetical protein
MYGLADHCIVWQNTMQERIKILNATFRSTGDFQRHKATFLFYLLLFILIVSISRSDHPKIKIPFSNGPTPPKLWFNQACVLTHSMQCLIFTSEANQLLVKCRT